MQSNVAPVGWVAALLLLAACDSLPSWIAGPDAPPLPGERIAILPQESSLEADPALASSEIPLPEPRAVSDWPQEGGNAGNHPGHMAYDGKFEQVDSTSAGKGNDFEGVLVPQPVVAGGRVFGMDAKGYVTAHDAKTLDTKWTYKNLVDEDEADALGGGLAAEEGVLYAVTGRGMAAAIAADSGKEIWKQPVGIPLRSAPRLAGGVLYVLSVDNQLFALDAATGSTVWSHRGIAETASYLGLVTPAATEDVVIAPYSSGEIKALRAGSGEEAWGDSLNRSRRTSAASIFNGIDANPVVASGIVFAISNGGLIAATELATGRRGWEQEIVGTNAPILVGQHLYLLSGDSELVCLQARDGRIRWVKALPRFEDDAKKIPYRWSGPLMLSGRLVVVGAHGVLKGFSPTDGSESFEKDIPDEVTTPPVLAGDTLYLMTQDARIVALR